MFTSNVENQMNFLLHITNDFGKQIIFKTKNAISVYMYIISFYVLPTLYTSAASPEQ